MSSGGIELTPLRITRDFLAMNDNILYEETCGQPEDGSISVQSEGAIIPLEYKTILSTLLRPIKDLGQGAFGKVYLASLGLVDSGDEVLVAVSFECVFKFSHCWCCIVVLGESLEKYF